MTLIKSISGIRGTIGGKPSEGLTPIDTVKFSAAFGYLIKQKYPNQKIKIVIGRDARISGEMINNLVVNTLIGLGIEVLDLGLSTTPTVEMAVPLENAQAGIILTASHNPAQWNALKLLNEKGEFISEQWGAEVLKIATNENIEFVEINELGNVRYDDNYLKKHIESICKLPLVNISAIEQKNFHIVCDCVNSTGGIAVPMLLEALGVKKITKLYCNVNGHFPHNPEPLPEHLTDISNEIKKLKADLGIVVDPDVDRLALVCENGDMFGEEYTLVAVADYVLKHQKGNTVSNLSSTRALRDVTEKHGGTYFASAVGEVNVVAMMKKVNAVIGGEGNGGIIYPDLHYGRDALVGIALFLSHLALSHKSASELRNTYPNYHISKNKIELTPSVDVENILKSMKEKFKSHPYNETDGLKIEFDNEWVHLRKSNTEPIIRIYAESRSEQSANALAQKIMLEIKQLAKTN
jgi:phosphomannomutase